MSLYESAVKKPITTALIFIGVAILGLFSLTRLPVDLFPDIEVNRLTVITAYSGASASDIEINVTRPMENTLNTVENLKKITSQSKDNMSLVTLEFNYGTDINIATNDVRDKIDMVKSQLPDDVTNPIIFKFSMDMIPVVIYSATATESVNALYKILDEKVANPLNRIAGVGAVTISGAPQRQVQVNVSPEKLEAYNLTVEQISRVIQAENLNVPAGSFDIGTTTYALRVEGEFKESNQLMNIVLGSRNGKNVYLKDVATVSDTIQSRIQEAYTNDVKGATIVVQKQSGSNTVDIAKKVNKIIPELQKTLPPDIQLSLIMDSSDFIQHSIDSLVETILLAGIFVILVVLFFLGRWRATVIIILAIPISLIASFIYLMATGSTLNIISLSSISISIGMVVDDAIVVLENITKHIEKGSTPKEAAVYATNEVGVAVIASSLTIIAVFFPLTMTTGLAGVMFGELGWMVTIMITVSVIVALSLTPMLCSQMLRLTNTQGKLFDKLYAPIHKALDKLDFQYARLVNLCVRNRWKTLLICFSIFFAIMLPALKIVKFDFMPSSDNSMITATVYLPTGTRMEVARETAKKIDNIVKANYEKEIKIRSFSVGQADENNTFAAMQENGTNLISFRFRCIDPDKRKLSIYDIADGLRKELSNMPELYKYVVTPGGSGGMMGTGASTVDVEIYGFDLALTDRIAGELKTRLASVKGLRDIAISRQDYRTEYQIDFDREKLAENGLNSATVASYVRNRINGSYTSKYREDGDEYDIVVRYDEAYRQSIEDIRNITVYNNAEIPAPIRLRELGTVVERSSLPQIDRQNRQRVNKVQGSLYGAALSDVVAGANSVIEAMRSEGKIPAEIGIKIGGSYEDQQETNNDLGLLMLLCVLLVYIVMAAQFESLTYPFIIVLSLTFGLAGVFLALMITGKSMSLMAMIGLVMLIGIVVKNGIVFIDYANLNRERGMSIDKAIISAGKSRLRPILMTTATTVLGMIPMAIPRGSGSEMWQPMGITIVGGLTLSTLLTLLYVPALYSIFGGNGVRRKRKKYRKSYNEQRVVTDEITKALNS
ncbi:MAG: efflux RND transporter permease subunit [Dysgonamonadaceae bacterium]|jgi:HAE1 family hydrophobic/amphiphilic exporter-1|nr:efflux RND transporter permease subunit [Dysgonamonadaceae bacterium]